MSYWTRNFPLRLTSVARSLSTGAAATLVHSFVTNRLDYCLSDSGLPSVRLSCLDRIQRFAARLIGQNTKVRSRNRLHVGGSALAPCPTAHRVQGCLLGVAVPVMNCSNLLN